MDDLEVFGKRNKLEVGLSAEGNPVIWVRAGGILYKHGGLRVQLDDQSCFSKRLG